MEETILFAQATLPDVGIGVLVALMLLEKLPPWVKLLRNGKAPTLPDQFNRHCALMEGMMESDSPRKHTEQLQAISAKLDRMCDRLDRLIELAEK